MKYHLDYKGRAYWNFIQPIFARGREYADILTDKAMSDDKFYLGIYYDRSYIRATYFSYERIIDDISRNIESNL